MKDITSTSFGLMIAYLLPGLVGLASLAFWSSTVRNVLEAFLRTESSIGLFLLVILVALIIGLLVTVFRYFIYEWFIYKIVCKNQPLGSTDFGAIGTQDAKLAAFRAAVDEHYRYHQFWGGMTIVLLLFCIGLFNYHFNEIDFFKLMSIIVGFILLEVILGVAALEAYKQYVTRAKSIMTGG